MNKGKDICRKLKSIRKGIAEENGIELETKECTYKGPCRGTCPHCEAEVRYLENALADRLRLGRAATVAGLALSLAACGSNPATQPADSVASRNGTRPMAPEDTDTARHLSKTSPTAWQEDTAQLEISTLGLILIDDKVDEMENTCRADSINNEILLGEETGEVGIFTVPEIEPEFPGGIEAMYKFLASNIRYPQLARENNISGKVYVTFVVETDGSLSNFRLLRDIGGGCGSEAIRVVKTMPKWKPGMQKGEPVRVQFNLPVKFSLSDIERIEAKQPETVIEVKELSSDDISGYTEEEPMEPMEPINMEVQGVKVIVR